VQIVGNSRERFGQEIVKLFRSGAEHLPLNSVCYLCLYCDLQGMFLPIHGVLFEVTNLDNIRVSGTLES